ncbi:MAG TPA: hypothetical protein VMQ40_06320 [Acidimicrobiales bacterium]|nr:hypothetical protein [Acidimicrobiales bacterium]
MARRGTKRTGALAPARRIGGERFARKVFLACGAVGVLLALSCIPAGTGIRDVSSTAFLRAVFAVPLLWVGLRGTYVTTRNLRRIRREIRRGAAQTELDR